MSAMDEFENLRKKAFEKYAPPNKDRNPVDNAVFGIKKLYDADIEKARELRFKAIKYAFTYHYSKSKYYNKFCKYLEVEPEEIKSEENLAKIPLISDLFFKDHPDAGKEFVEWLSKIYVSDFPKIEKIKKSESYDKIIDIFQNLDITLLFSSGTSGSFSFVPRDRLTWNRQMYVCSRIFEMADCQFQSKKSKIIWLGPDPRKTHLYIGRLTTMLTDLFEENQLLFGYNKELTIEIIKLLMGTKTGFPRNIKSTIIRPFVLSEQNKMFENIINFLEKMENDMEIGIGGTPFFIDMLMSKIEEKGLTFDFDDKGIIVTAGGWKIYSDFEIPIAGFHKRVKDIFGISPENCRDIYGMVECNALYLSCEGHYKHIPHSFLYPMVLNEESEPLGFGETGRFAFLDPTANSYPGFIMTGDKVKILEKCPVCERSGPVICEDISRLSGIQDRGCGATLAKMFSEELNKNSEQK
jgi:phenylacetate-coenzyme A ligase PaaK-like adenylate-forming protein